MYKIVILSILLVGCNRPNVDGIDLVTKKCNAEHGQITMSYQIGRLFDTLTASCQFPKIEK